jgi:hypothetical protein
VGTGAVRNHRLLRGGGGALGAFLSVFATALSGALRAGGAVVVVGGGWGQAAGGGSACRRMKAAASSLAQGQLAGRRRVARRAWKASRPAVCSSR